MHDEDHLSDLTLRWARRARDAAYVTVGLGVLGYHNVQTARRMVRRAAGVERQVSGIIDEVAAGIRFVEDRMRNLTEPRS